jgi:hypothetical protein
MSVAGEDLRILDERPDRFAFFAWKNITICVWLALPDASEVARLVKAGEARVAQTEQKLSDVHLIVRKVGLPTAETRSAFLSASRSGSPHLAAVAVMVANGGFWASAVRSFVTGLNVLVKGPFDLAMFAEVGELAAWLSPIHEARTGIAVAREQLSAVLREAQLRAERSAR